MISRLAYLVSCFVVLAIPASSIVARTWHIKADGTGDAPTIQAGVDSAAVGDTVLVAAGVYSDTVHVEVDGTSMIANLHITKSVSVIGEAGIPAATIDARDTDVSVLIDGQHTWATIKHLVITRDYTSPGCILDYLTPKSPAAPYMFGVWSRNASLTFEENVVRDIGLTAIYLEGAVAYFQGNEIDDAIQGVLCTSGADVTVAKNEFTRCVYPVIGNFSKMMIVGNVIEGQGGDDTCIGIGSTGCRASITENIVREAKFYAIDCGGGDDVVIEDNLITGAREGLVVQNSDSVVVRGNVFYRCLWAIDVLIPAYLLIENNTFDANITGIVCQLGTDPIIRNNIIVRGNAGVFCDTGSSPTIECNDVFQMQYPYYGCGDHAGLDGNIAVDPEFCGIDDSGNYFLQSDSPCAPGNHPGDNDCALIGALGVNCGTVSAQKRSWGSIKSLYRSDD